MKSRFLFFIPLAAITAGGIFALWLMTGGQPGLVNDSAAYIGGAESLLAGHGFSFPYRVGEWTPTVHFPPLFSLLIAGLSWLGAIQVVQAAYVLNLFLFGANIALAGLLVWRLTRKRSWPLLAAVFVVVSPGLLWTHAFALSEPLFLCILLAFLHALLAYGRGLSRLALLSAALLAVLGFWTRYAGVALFLSGVLAILLYSSRRPWKLHHRDLALFLTVSLPGVLLLVLRNAWVGGSLANRSLLFHPPDAAKWLEGAHQLWGFFLPEQREGAPLLAVIFALLIVSSGLALSAAPFLGKERPTFSTRHPLQGAALAAMTGSAYLVVVVLAMVFFDASTIFEARILTPFVLCTLLAGLAALSEYQPRLAGHWQAVPLATAVVFLVLALVSGANLVRKSSWDGLGFSAAYWRSSTTFQALETLPEVNIYSTRPMGIYLLSGRPATFIPDAYNPVTGQEALDAVRAEKIEQMHREVLQGEAVVVIFEYPSMTVNPYEVEWARQVTAGLPLLVMLPDGAIHGDADLWQKPAFVPQSSQSNSKNYALSSPWFKGFFLLILFAWLAVCVVHDLKTRTVPLSMTLLPLLAAGLFRLFSATWLLPLYILALMLLSDLPPKLSRLAALALGLLLGTLQPDLLPELAGLLFTWSLWSFGFAGGADARLLMALVLLFGDAGVLLPIWIAGGLLGLLGLLRKEKTIPYTPAIAIGTGWYLLVPYLTGKEENLMKFLADNKAIESSEVALIIAVVVLVAYGAYKMLGQNIANVVQDIASKIGGG